VRLAGLPLVVVVEVVVFVWMVLDVASMIVSKVGVFIVVVFRNPRSLAVCWKKILHLPI
jgi:hypothetical protein